MEEFYIKITAKLIVYDPLDRDLIGMDDNDKEYNCCISRDNLL